MKIDEYAISDGLLWKAWAGGRSGEPLVEGAQRNGEKEDWELGVYRRKPSDVREAEVTARSKTEEWGEQLKPVLVSVYTSARIDASLGA